MGLISRLRSGKRAKEAYGTTVFLDEGLSSDVPVRNGGPPMPNVDEGASSATINAAPSAVLGYWDREGLEDRPIALPPATAAPSRSVKLAGSPDGEDDKSAAHTESEADPHPDFPTSVTPGDVDEVLTGSTEVLTVQLPPPPATTAHDASSALAVGTEADAWMKALATALALAQTEDASKLWVEAAEAAGVILELTRAHAARAEAREQAEEKAEVAQAATQAADAAKSVAERTAAVAQETAAAARAAAAAADSAKREVERAVAAVPTLIEEARVAVDAANEAKHSAQDLEQAVTKARTENTLEGWAGVLAVRHKAASTDGPTANDERPSDSVEDS
jgi:hypothetical protein